MKKSMIILGLLALGAHQVHGMESKKEEKSWEKDFRIQFAGVRAAYVLQQFLNAAGQQENACEANLRMEYEDFLNVYKQYHSFANQLRQKDFEALEKFKTKEVQKFFNACNKKPKQSVVSGYSQPTNQMQKDFCRILAGCRGLDILQMFREATSHKSENKAEKRLRQEFQQALNQYRRDNPDNEFIITNIEKLEVLNQEARAFFNQCK